MEEVVLGQEAELGQLGDELDDVALGEAGLCCWMEGERGGAVKKKSKERERIEKVEVEKRRRSIALEISMPSTSFFLLFCIAFPTLALTSCAQAS